MYDNEITTNEEDVGLTAPDTESTEPTPEELPMEDKKKAINLEDLVFIRQFLDKRTNEIQEQVSNEINDQVSTKIESEVADKVQETISGDYYNKTESNATFYLRTDTVDNAVHAVSADEATYAAKADHADNAGNSETINNLEIIRDENGLIKIDGVIIPQKKLLFDSADGSREITGLNLSADKIYEIHAKVIGEWVSGETYNNQIFTLKGLGSHKQDNVYISETGTDTNVYLLSFAKTIFQITADTVRISESGVRVVQIKDTDISLMWDNLNDSNSAINGMINVNSLIQGSSSTIYKIYEVIQ